MKRSTPVYTKEQVFIEDFDYKKIVNLQYEIEKISFFQKGFAILVVRVLKNNQHLLFSENKVSLKGKFVNPRVGDRFWGSGRIYFDERYGYVIDTKNTNELIYPRAEKDIIKYIVGRVAGLGKVKAQAIVDYFGENTLRTLELEPDKIKDVPNLKITEAIKKSLVSELSTGKSIHDVMSFLTANKFEESLAFDIFETYGLESLEKLKNNPYILSDIKVSLWSRADRLFKAQKDLNKKYISNDGYANANIRYRGAIKFYLMIALDANGSLAVNQQTIINDFTSGEFLNKYGSFKNTIYNMPSKEIVNKQLIDMETEGTIVRSKSRNGDYYIYMSASYFAEKKIVSSIKKFNKTSQRITTTKETKEFIEFYENQTGFKLADKQKLAVDLLVNNKISILTGGPGTGKTQTLLAVKNFNAYLEKAKIISNASISFLAPTGKAARRMSEVLDVDAETIHRKLKLLGFGNESDPVPIEEQYVVVDESSMIDLKLFEKLLTSLKPGAHLLLVGDENQLPSVGAGLILRDLINSGKVNTVLLDTVFRQKGGSLLVDNATKMKNGIGYHDGHDNNNSLIFDKSTKDVLADSYFIPTEHPFQTKNKALSSLNLILNKYKFSFDDIMILTPQKTGIIGTNNINNIIQQTYNPNYGSDDVIIRKIDAKKFYVNDKVIQLENNYTDNVFNGEIGTITDIEVSPNGYVMTVQYPGHIDDIKYSGNDIMQLDLAYAITVHKSQGSEAPVVIQLVDKSHQSMLNRSLIYTAYTRTKKTNIIIGQKDALNLGLLDISNLQRTSLIKEKL